MRLWFCQSNTLVGWLIRAVTFCRWNHVAIEIDGLIYEASLFSGVRCIPAEGFTELWSKAISCDVAVTNPAKAAWFLNQQIGKPYDLWALVPLRRNWQHPHKWFCSELAAKALTMAGQKSFHMDQHRVWPRDLWAVAPWLNDASIEPA